MKYKKVGGKRKEGKCVYHVRVTPFIDETSNGCTKPYMMREYQNP